MNSPYLPTQNQIPDFVLHCKGKGATNEEINISMTIAAYTYKIVVKEMATTVGGDTPTFYDSHLGGVSCI